MGKIQNIPEWCAITRGERGRLDENDLSKSHFRQYFTQMEELSIIVQYYICLGVLLTYSVEKNIQMALRALVPPPRGSKYPHPRGEILLVTNES